MNPKGLAKPFDHLRFAASSQGVFHIRGAQLPPLSLIHVVHFGVPVLVLQSLTYLMSIPHPTRTLHHHDRYLLNARTLAFPPRAASGV